MDEMLRSLEWISTEWNHLQVGKGEALSITRDGVYCLFQALDVGMVASV